MHIRSRNITSIRAAPPAPHLWWMRVSGGQCYLLCLPSHQLGATVTLKSQTLGFHWRPSILQDQSQGWGEPALCCSATVKSGLINHTRWDTTSSWVSEMKVQLDDDNSEMKVPSPSPSICSLLWQTMSALCSGLNQLQLILRSEMAA